MVRVRLRYADLDTFVERFAPNVTRGGIFLASRNPRPEGEVFHFEVQLAGGAVALAGEGKVIWIKPFNPAEPQKPHGMGVQFVSIDPGSREVLARILEFKGPSGRRTGGVPGRTTQPLQTLQAAGLTNGKAHIDTSVDLASEYGIDEQVLRRVIDRNWTLGSRADDELQDLLKPDLAQPISLAQALADLPRLLDPTSRRRSGAFRSLELLATTPAPAPVLTPEPVTAIEPATSGAIPGKISGAIMEPMPSAATATEPEPAVAATPADSGHDPNEITYQEPDRQTPPEDR
jgi:uncharacterized protein (TIGR02266 family)